MGRTAGGGSQLGRAGGRWGRVREHGRVTALVPAKRGSTTASAVSALGSSFSWRETCGREQSRHPVRANQVQQAVAFCLGDGEAAGVGEKIDSVQRALLH